MTPFLVAFLLAVPGLTALAHEPPAPRKGQALPIGARQRWLDVNHLSLPFSNLGSYAWNLDRFEGGLLYPRASGKPLAYAAGFWVAGRAGPHIRTAIAEFGWEFTPGPIVGGTTTIDPVRNDVYQAAPSDTTGWAAWVARAAPMGAPLDPSGTRPGFLGDQMLWTVFNDADPSPEGGLRYGKRLTPPIGLEVQLTAYAFNRPGPLRDAVFLHYRIIHKGVAALDSVRIGLFLDPVLGWHGIRGACDPARDLGYAYRNYADDPIHGVAGPAVGLGVARLVLTR